MDRSGRRKDCSGRGVDFEIIIFGRIKVRAVVVRALESCEQKNYSWLEMQSESHREGDMVMTK